MSGTGKDVISAGKVAIVTGGASGIGFSFAKQAASEGMHVVLADNRAEPLAKAEAELQATGAQTLAQVVDVRRPEDLESLAAACYERFGAAHLLFNNAGVMMDGLAWTRSLEDWRWCMDVNLYGIVNGCNAFVPRMLEQDAPAWIVNTSSQAGLMASPALAVYTASKHAVLGFTECLLFDLQGRNADIGISVLCPGGVATNLMKDPRRPQEYGTEAPRKDPGEAAFHEFLVVGMDTGMSPDAHATLVFEEIRQGLFWLLPHKECLALCEDRVRGMVEGKVPQFGGFPDAPDVVVPLGE